MGNILNIFIFIAGIILFPALIGVLWVVCFGVPIFLLMKGWEIFTCNVINPAFVGINKIPGIGRIFTSFIALMISITMIAAIVMLFEIPIVFFIAHALGN